MNTVKRQTFLSYISNINIDKFIEGNDGKDFEKL